MELTALVLADAPSGMDDKGRLRLEAGVLDWLPQAESRDGVIGLVALGRGHSVRAARIALEVQAAGARRVLLTDAPTFEIPARNWWTSVDVPASHLAAERGEHRLTAILLDEGDIAMSSAWVEYEVR